MLAYLVDQFTEAATAAAKQPGKREADAPIA
jgi:hypothetical protein